MLIALLLALRERSPRGKARFQRARGPSPEGEKQHLPMKNPPFPFDSVSFPISIRSASGECSPIGGSSTSRRKFNHGSCKESGGEEGAGEEGGSGQEGRSEEGGPGEEGGRQEGPGQEGGSGKEGRRQEGGSGKEGRCEEGARQEADPERGLHEAADPGRVARGRGGQQPAAAHGNREQAVGLHQEEQA